MTNNRKEANALFNSYLKEGQLERKLKHIPSRRQIKDEMTQESLIALWKAALNFDNSKGATFSTYVYPYIDGAIKKVWKTLKNSEGASKKHSIDSLYHDPKGHIEARLDIQKGLESLSPQDRVLVELHYLQGYTIEEIAKIRCRSKAAISMKIKKIEKKLKRTLTN